MIARTGVRRASRWSAGSSKTYMRTCNPLSRQWRAVSRKSVDDAALGRVAQQGGQRLGPGYHCCHHRRPLQGMMAPLLTIRSRRRIIGRSSRTSPACRQHTTARAARDARLPYAQAAVITHRVHRSDRLGDALRTNQNRLAGALPTPAPVV
jgi:hypothetical protein